MQSFHSTFLRVLSTPKLAVFESLAVHAREVLVCTGLTVLGEKLDLARRTEEIPTCVSEPRCLARRCNTAYGTFASNQRTSVAHSMLSEMS